jgi:hypothetical protein
MAAHGTGTETVLLGREVGGDEGKDIQRDAICASERVPPFANSRQRGRGLLIKLRHLIERDAAEEVSALGIVPRRWSMITYDGKCVTRFSFSFRAKTSCEIDRSCPG